MKAHWVIAGLLALCAALPARAETNPFLIHPGQMKFAPLKFDPPKPVRKVLSNGIVVYLLEDHEIPVVNLYAYARGGYYLCPEAKAGIDDIYGTLLRTGGTKTLKPDALNDELEFMPAYITTGMGGEHCTASLDALTKDLPRALEIFADVLLHPDFDAAKLDLRKKQIVEGLRRWNDDAGSILGREFHRLMYAGHPFGTVATTSSVNGVTREDLFALHEKCWYADNVLMGVAGDFSTDQMVKDLERLFAEWKPRGKPLPPPPEVTDNREKGLYYIEKDTTQTKIEMGLIGITRDDPDFFALDVMDNVLGGNSFASRLVKEVRSNRGLAYSVNSSFSGGRLRGVVEEFCGTKPKSTVEALTVMRQITADLAKTPPGPDELAVAKDSILQAQAFSFTSASKIVWRQVFYEAEGMPPDYLTRYFTAIEKVSSEDVARVAKRLLNLDKMIVLVVGNQKEFDKPLSTLGPVKVRPLENFDR